MKPSKALRIMRDDNEIDINLGICSNYRITTGNDDLEHAMTLHGITFADWSLWSGSFRYPVYAFNPYPDEARNIYMCGKKKWDKSTQYGRNRWALLDWLIEQFEAKGA